MGQSALYVVLDLLLNSWLNIEKVNPNINQDPKCFQMLKYNHKNVNHALFAKSGYFWESKLNMLIVNHLLMCSIQIFPCSITFPTKTNADSRWIAAHISSSFSNSNRSGVVLINDCFP